MTSEKKARARAMVDFLRQALSSMAASTAGGTPHKRAVSMEVQQELDATLELYAEGGIENPRQLLADFTAPPPSREPSSDPSVPIR